MLNFIKTYRPAGNPVRLQAEDFDFKQFEPFQITFYQSGTAALAASLVASIKLKSANQDRADVILPAYGCPDLISAIIYAGANPVLIDLDSDLPWLSLEQVEKAITDKTVAIIAVRFLGIPERMDELRTLCNKYNLILIEDSAQGFPTSNPDSYWQGDLNILSFGRGKPINMLGGGAVLTRNDEIQTHLINPAEQLNSLSGTAKYLVKLLIYNTLINPVVYGLALKLPGLKIGETVYKELSDIAAMPRAIKERLTPNINAYKTFSSKLVDIQTAIKALNSSKISDLVLSSHHELKNPLLRYPLLIADKSLRDKLHTALMPLGSSIMYRKPLIYIDNLPASVLDKNITYTVAENFADRLITLPTHSGVSSKLLKEIFSRITKILM